MTYSTLTNTCSVNDCNRKTQSRGLCTTHYSAWYRRQKNYTITCANCGITVKVARKHATTCGRKCAATVGALHKNKLDNKDKPEVSCLGCGAMFEIKGNKKYCTSECYRSYQRRTKDNTRSALRRAIEDRDSEAILVELYNRTVKGPTGCWEWIGRIDNGYPVVRYGGKEYSVHRVSLEAKENAPLGVQSAHHKCSNTRCVNPEHLQPVTAKDNTAEMLARRSYVERIKELEKALREVDPTNPVLDRVGYQGG